MRYIIGAGLLTVLIASLSFGAAGDRTPAGKAKFDTVSTSTKRSCTAGEIRYNTKFTYFCQRTNVFHRISTASF